MLELVLGPVAVESVGGVLLRAPARSGWRQGTGKPEPFRLEIEWCSVSQEDESPDAGAGVGAGSRDTPPPNGCAPRPHTEADDKLWTLSLERSRPLNDPHPPVRRGHGAEYHHHDG
jgi:hypothetical protein